MSNQGPIKTGVLARQQDKIVSKADLSSNVDKKPISTNKTESGVPQVVSGNSLLRTRTSRAPIGFSLGSVLKNTSGTKPKQLSTFAVAQKATVLNRPTYSLFPINQKDTKKDRLLKAATEILEGQDQKTRALLAQQLIRGIDVTLLAPEFQIQNALIQGLERSLLDSKKPLQAAFERTNARYQRDKKDLQDEISALENAQRDPNNLASAFFDAQVVALKEKQNRLDDLFKKTREQFDQRSDAIDKERQEISDNVAMVKDLSDSKLKATTVQETNQIELEIAALNQKISNLGFGYYSELSDSINFLNSQDDKIYNEFQDTTLVRDRQIEALDKIDQSKLNPQQKQILELLRGSAGILTYSVYQSLLDNITLNQAQVDAQIQENLKLVAQKDKEIEDFKKIQATLESQLKEKDRDIENLEGLNSELLKRQLELEQTIRDKNAELEQNEQQLQQKLSEISTLEKQVSNLSAENQQLLTDLKQKRLEVNALEGLKSKQSEEIESLKQETDSLKQKLQDAQKTSNIELQSANQKIESISRDLSVANKAIQDKNADIQKLKEQLDLASKTSGSRVNELEQNIIKANEAIQASQKQNESLRSELSVLQAKNRDLQAQRDQAAIDLKNAKSSISSDTKGIQEAVKNLFDNVQDQKEITRKLLSAFLESKRLDFVKVIPNFKKATDLESQIEQVKQLSSLEGQANFFELFGLDKFQKLNSDLSSLNKIDLTKVDKSTFDAVITVGNDLNAIRLARVNLVLELSKTNVETGLIDPSIDPILNQLRDQRLKLNETRNDLDKRVSDIKKLQKQLIEKDERINEIAKDIAKLRLDLLRSVETTANATKQSADLVSTRAEVTAKLNQQEKEILRLKRLLGYQEDLTNVKIEIDDNDRTNVQSKVLYSKEALLSNVLGIEKDEKQEKSGLAKGGGAFWTIKSGSAVEEPTTGAFSFASLFQETTSSGQDVKNIFYSYFDEQDKYAKVLISSGNENPAYAFEIVKQWRKFTLNAFRFDLLYQFLRIIQAAFQTSGGNQGWTIKKDVGSTPLTLLYIFFDSIRQGKGKESEVAKTLYDQAKATTNSQQGAELQRQIKQLGYGEKGDSFNNDIIQRLTNLWEDYHTKFEAINRGFENSYSVIEKAFDRVRINGSDVSQALGNLFDDKTTSILAKVKPFNLVSSDKQNHLPILTDPQVDFSIRSNPTVNEITKKIELTELSLKPQIVYDGPFQNYKWAFDFILRNITAPKGTLESSRMFNNGRYEIPGYTTILSPQ